MQPNVIRYSVEFIGFGVNFRVGLGLASGVRVGLGSAVKVGFRVSVRIRVRVGFRVVLGLNLVQGCPVLSHYHNYKSIYVIRYMLFCQAFLTE